MPKLNPKQAKTVEATEAWETGSGYTLLDEGRYAAQLYTVTERTGRVAPVWNWRFVNVHNEDGEPQGRTNLFHSTSLSPKAAGRLKQVFQAFGYTTDSDTDEITGEWAVLYVAQEIREQGKNAGQRVNVIKSISSFNEDDWDFDPASVPAYKERSDSYEEHSNSGAGASSATDDDAF